MPARTSGPTSRRSSEAEAGTGLIGSLVGITVFLTLILFATHVVLILYATSVVTAAAFDAARLRAGGDLQRVSEAEAERQARELLGDYEREGSLRFTWRYPSTDGDARPDVVELQVVAEHPTSLLPDLGLPLQRVDRTISVRLERPR
ncbi:MAG: hypothetical protein ACRDZ9_05945 [Acidimicrobiales bacterium]